MAIMSKYIVFLSNCGNIDYGQDFTNILPHTEKEISLCDTIGQCSDVCRDYIEENDLGGGNWNGGYVYKGGEQVAYISYNGRIWTRGDKYFRLQNNNSLLAI
jgi:hypothetical protein